MIQAQLWLQIVTYQKYHQKDSNWWILLENTELYKDCFYFVWLDGLQFLFTNQVFWTLCWNLQINNKNCFYPMKLMAWIPKVTLDQLWQLCMISGMLWVEHHFIKHQTNLNIIFRTMNELECVHLLVIKLEHPIFGFEQSNIERTWTSFFEHWTNPNVFIYRVFHLLCTYFKWP